MDAALGCIILFFTTGLFLMSSPMVYMIYVEAFKEFTLVTLIRPDVIFATILLGLSIALGYKGFILIWRYIDVKYKGKNTYAIVAKCTRHESSSSSGRTRTSYYHITYLIKNDSEEIKKVVKHEMCHRKYGEFVQVKQYKNNIIVDDTVKDEEVPQILREKLISEMQIKYSNEEKNN